MLRFSILIASYNHGRHVGAAVESCLAQTFPAGRYETIVVDDGSTDNSREVLQRFRGDARVKLIEQANAGQMAAFAAGFAACSGEIVCLLDCDDLFEPNKLQVLDAVMGNAQDGLLCHDLQVFRDPGEPLGLWWNTASVPGASGVLTAAQLAEAPHAYPFSNPCGMVCGRDMLARALRSIPAAEWRVGVDNVLGWSLFVLGGRVRYLPQVLGRYRLHAANTFLRQVGATLEGRRAWQNAWPRMLPHIEALVAGSELPAAERQAWSEVVRGFRPVADDGRSTRPDRLLPDRAALADWARELLASSAAVRGPGIAEMEAWARSLLGLAFLGEEAGAQAWRTRRERLARGVDPAATDGWGAPADHDQRIVELADIALALCLAPAQLWEPLPPDAKRRVLEYLRVGFAREVHANNWLWFRVAIGVALERLGGAPDRARLESALDRLDTYATASGWYSDGAEGPCDHYNAWTFHFHALLYTRLDPKAAPERCERLRARAARFAQEYVRWFAPGGAALAYGRSATYRFAVAGFWALLAWAGVDALPQGDLKGLTLRHLRWWKLRLAGGPLAVGHAYPNPRAGEFYVSEGSPYAAARGFAALLLPASHEFWRTAELPQPTVRTPQPQAGLLTWASDLGGGLVNALCAGTASPQAQVHRPAAYARFCYSTHFGFGVSEDSLDSALALSDDGKAWRCRARGERGRIGPELVYSEWRPWDDALVRTWLAPAGAWHVRIHAIQSARALSSVEGGFALGHAGEHEGAAADGEAFARSAQGSAGVLELAGSRQADLLEQPPGVNLMHPRTVLPVLRGTHAGGISWLVGAFLGTRSGMKPPPPRAQAIGNGYEVVDAHGKVLLRLAPKTRFQA